MTAAPGDHRGGVAGMLGPSRNPGLITGAAVLGAVFAFASASSDVTTATPLATAVAIRSTLAVAAALVVLALRIATRRPLSDHHQVLVGQPDELSRVVMMGAAWVEISARSRKGKGTRLSRTELGP